MKKIFIPVLLVALIAGCSYNNLTVRTTVKGNILSNIKLLYTDSASGARQALTEGSTVAIDSDGYQTLHVDLSGTSEADHIKLTSEMKRGMKVFVVVLRADNKQEIARTEVPLRSIEGYRQQNTQTITYDRRGRPVGEPTMVAGERRVVGETEYSDNSVIPVDVNFASASAGRTEAVAFVEIDYSAYEQDRNINSKVFNGTDLASDLQKSPKDVTVTHTINYREAYFDTVRKTRSTNMVISKPGAPASAPAPVVTPVENGNDDVNTIPAEGGESDVDSMMQMD